MILGKGIHEFTFIELSKDGDFSPQSLLALHLPPPQRRDPTKLGQFPRHQLGHVYLCGPLPARNWLKPSSTRWILILLLPLAGLSLIPSLSLHVLPFSTEPAQEWTKRKLVVGEDF